MQGGLRRIESMPANLEAVSEVAVEITSEASQGNIPKRNNNRLDRIVGTVVHLVLEHFARIKELPQDLRASFEQGWNQQQWQFELRRLGLSGADLSRAQESVESSVAMVLQDKEGRWLFDSSHRDASSELALTIQTENTTPQNIIIDRTFVDSKTGTRWIVDYKNSQPGEGEQLRDFLNREETQYLPQLSLYKSAMAALGEEPIQCALYFTALGYLQVVDPGTKPSPAR